jgi:hypothetical protein
MEVDNKEKLLLYHREYNRKWMAANRKKNGDAVREYDRARREANPAKRLLAATKQSAKLKGLEHNITEADIICVPVCPLLGITIDYTAGTGKTLQKPSVDRIDPTKGYIRGNIEVMSGQANLMKNKSTRDELITFANNILKRYESSSG